MMNKAVLVSLGSAMLAGSAFAGINAFKVENLWGNNTGTFASSLTYPSVNMLITNQNNTALNSFGDRFCAWLSADGGLTKAKINGKKDFTLEFEVKLNLDGAATRPLEAGLLMNYLNKSGFVPTSQFYVKYTKAGVPVPVITTSNDWVIPGYDFFAAGADYADGDTVKMAIIYDYNDATPSSSTTELKFGTYTSGPLNGNWGGPVYDNEMELGLYFQPLVEAGNPTHSANGLFKVTNFTGTLVGAAAPMTATVDLGTWDYTNGSPTLAWQIRNAGGTVLQSGTTVPSNTGAISIPATASGTFWIKGAPFLGKTKTGAGPGINLGTIVLLNGDIDGDNSVTILDYSVLSDYFDKTSGDADWSTVGGNGFKPQAADIDNDGAVSILDYSILSDDFDMMGID